MNVQTLNSFRNQIHKLQVYGSKLIVEQLDPFDVIQGQKCLFIHFGQSIEIFFFSDIFRNN